MNLATWVKMIPNSDEDDPPIYIVDLTEMNSGLSCRFRIDMDLAMILNVIQEDVAHLFTGKVLEAITNSIGDEQEYGSIQGRINGKPVDIRWHVVGLGTDNDVDTFLAGDR